MAGFSILPIAKHHPGMVDPRLADLLTRKPVRVATAAMANNTAQIVWAVMTRGEVYRPRKQLDRGLHPTNTPKHTAPTRASGMFRECWRGGAN
ncbi:hypothetical protein [Croceibacterium ferulae]|uniref:hypothetical protein n=1 Tax=Croceibacterium ferulae TaxID=1854641 RepID=UPI000EB026A6|nr:hypothetical protein [Croceibacterium ferulae]